MPKVIQSPVTQFPGTVTLYDPLTMPQVVIIDECLLNRRQYFEEVDIDGGERGYVLKGDTFPSAPDTVGVGAIVECVQEFALKNFPDKVTAETFPGSPRGPSRELISWLILEIIKVYNGETEIPNE